MKPMGSAYRDFVISLIKSTSARVAITGLPDAPMTAIFVQEIRGMGNTDLLRLS
jgi:hypothetical protein